MHNLKFIRCILCLGLVAFAGVGYSSERPKPLSRYLEVVKGNYDSGSPEVKSKIGWYLTQADKLIAKAVFKRVNSVEDYKLLDDVQARKIGLHGRAKMIKNKDVADQWARASQDIAISREVLRELPLLAACYKISGDKKYLDYLVKQLEEIVTWDPVQRGGWTIRPNTTRLVKTSPVWLPTGTMIQAIVMMSDILPSGSLPAKLSAKIDKLVAREVGYTYRTWKDKTAWYVMKNTVQSNQWIVPNSALILGSLYLGKDKYTKEYELGIKNLNATLAKIGTEGAGSEGWGYSLDWTVPTLQTMAFYMAAYGDKSLQDNPYIKGFPRWFLRVYQPGRYLVNCFDWWGGNRDMYDRYMAANVFKVTVFSESPELMWIARHQHREQAPNVFSMIISGQEESQVVEKEPPLYGISNKGRTLVWRSSWKDNADGVWIRGMQKDDFHAHEDTGHVNYIVNGKLVLLEAGTTGYSDPRQYPEFTSARGHNILQIGEKYRFRKNQDATFKVNRLDASGGDVVLDGSAVYEGMKRWHRLVQWDEKSLRVGDSVKLEAVKKMIMRWHLATENTPEISHNADKTEYIIKVAAGKIEFPNWIGDRKFDYWQIKEGKDIVLTPQISVKIKSSVPVEITTEMMVEHTMKYRARYHKHATLVVKSVKPEREAEFETSISAK